MSSISPNPAKAEQFANLWEPLSHGSPFGDTLGGIGEKMASAYVNVPQVKAQAIAIRFQDPLIECGLDVIDGRYADDLVKALIAQKNNVTQAILFDDLVDTHGLAAKAIVLGIDTNENQRFPFLLYNICKSSDVGMPDWMAKMLALEISYACGDHYKTGFALYKTFRDDICTLGMQEGTGDLVKAEKEIYHWWKGPGTKPVDTTVKPPLHPWQPGYSIATVTQVTDEDIAWLEQHSNWIAVGVAKARKADLEKSAAQHATEQAEIDANPVGKDALSGYLAGKYTRTNEDGSVQTVDGSPIPVVTVPVTEGVTASKPMNPLVTVGVVVGVILVAAVVVSVVKD